MEITTTAAANTPGVTDVHAGREPITTQRVDVGIDGDAELDSAGTERQSRESTEAEIGSRGTLPDEELTRGEIHALMAKLKNLSHRSGDDAATSVERQRLQIEANTIVTDLTKVGAGAPAINTNLLGASLTAGDPTNDLPDAAGNDRTGGAVNGDHSTSAASPELSDDAAALVDALTAEQAAIDAAITATRFAASRAPLDALAAHTARIPASISALLR